MALDNSLAEAHASLALVKASFDWDWAAPDRQPGGSPAEPKSPMALYSRARFLTWMGRHEEAIAIAKHAVELDPVAPHANDWLGTHYFMARRYDEAIGQLNKVVSLEPDHYDAHVWLSYSYAKKGMHDEAAARASRLSRPWLDAWILALAGKSAEARRVPGQIDSEWATAPTGGYFTAVPYGELGEKDRAFALLEQAYKGRSPLMSVLKVDPRIDSLRSDRRFRALLQRMNFPE